jgi:hypothetical protein
VRRVRRLARFDRGVLVSARVAGHVPGAASGILRFAGFPFRDPLGLKFGIAGDIPEAFPQRPFELMTNAFDTIRVNADQIIRPGGVLCFTARPLGGAVGGKLYIANDFAKAFLHGSLYQVAKTFEVILVHDGVLSPACQNWISTSPRTVSLLVKPAVMLNFVPIWK